MKVIYLYIIFSLFLSANVNAQYWSFTKPIDIGLGNIDKVYHHLESAGRHNIAVSANTIAVVWEDNRNDNPSVYLALKSKDKDDFSIELKISGDGEAFEPSIISLPENRFAISWEEDRKIAVRIINTKDIGKPDLADTIQLPAKEAMQSSLTVNGNQLLLTLSERVERHNQIKLVQLNIDNQNNLKLVRNCRIDSEPVNNDQLYPTAVIINDRILIAWEDRRMGHTIIMSSLSQAGNICQFSQPQRVSQRPGKRKLPYGKGHGVSRVALTQYNTSEVLAAWADKRNFREGYDIFASTYSKQGIWENNQSVQDEFGGVARQWHTTVAGHSNGNMIVAWSDERENNSDIFYSWFEQGEWSDDLPIPGASGIGEQTHPSIIFDDDGNIHITWIVRKEVGGSTRLKYILGHLISK